MSELRKRMIRDMKLRNFSPGTQRAYLRAVAGLAQCYQRSPDTIGPEEIQDYVVYLLSERKLTVGIRRFLLHVLPDSYVRIRHYGFLANRCKREDMAKCRELLGLSADLPAFPEETAQEKMLRLTDVDVAECPRCKQGRMRRVIELPILAICASRDSPLLLKTYIS